MRSLTPQPSDAGTAPQAPPPPDAISGWLALHPMAKWGIVGCGAIFGIWYVMRPDAPKVNAAPAQEQHLPARIADAPDPPPAQDPLQRISSNNGALLDTPEAPRHRHKPKATEMSLYSAPLIVAPAVAPQAARAAGTAGAGTAGGGEELRDGPGILPGPAHQDALSAQVNGATTLPRVHATPVGNPDFLIRPGAKIPCLPIDAMDSSRTGFTSCRTVEWFPSSNMRRGLIPPGTVIFGQIRSGLAAGETRLGILYTLIELPNYDMPLAAPAADEMGRSGANGDVRTFFWDKLEGVAAYALMDVAVGAGQNVASSALSSAFGSGGTTLNLGSQAQTLASQQFQSASKAPILTRDQALPLTVSIGQNIDFTSFCAASMRNDPMACPAL